MVRDATAVPRDIPRGGGIGLGRRERLYRNNYLMNGVLHDCRRSSTAPLSIVAMGLRNGGRPERAADNSSVIQCRKLVPEDGLEPSRGQAPRDFKSGGKSALANNINHLTRTTVPTKHDRARILRAQ